MKIGILGGTFNPVHFGHLAMAETVRQKFRLDKILFIPCAIPPHKAGRKLPDPWVRHRMLELAISGNRYFTASDLEIRRGGKSYSYETLCALHQDSFGKDRFFFIVGSDSLAQILSWYRIRDLMRLCRFIVVERPGFTAKALLAAMKPPDRLYFEKYVLKDFPVGISSRRIRQRVQKGLSVRYLVPDSVEAFLAENRPYRTH